MIRTAHPASPASAQESTYSRHLYTTARRAILPLGRGVVGARQSLRRAICLLLIIALLSTSTPAAPVVLTELAGQWQSELGFRFYTSGWSATMSNLFTLQGGRRAVQPQEKQEDRDARVRRIEIQPGDVTAHVEERLVFSAIAYEQDGTPVGGVHFTWSAQDEGRGGRAMRITQRGNFEAVAPGNYKITVESGGRRAHVHVRVLDGRGRKRNDRPSDTRDVSSRQQPQGLVSLPTPKRKGGNSSAQHAPRAPQFVNADYKHVIATKPGVSIILCKWSLLMRIKSRKADRQGVVELSLWNNNSSNSICWSAISTITSPA